MSYSTEGYFPRGGSKQPLAKKKAPKWKQAKVKENQDLQNALVESEKIRALESHDREKGQSKKQRRTPNKIKTALFKVADMESRLSIEQLSLKLLTPGMLVLGCIRTVRDYELVISLPGGITGFVPISCISDLYTGHLQRLTEGDVEDIGDLKSLYELFKTGQLVRCKVTEIQQPKPCKTVISLSINPKDVNEGVAANGLRDGMVLTASVSSMEDHGYVMDIGIKSVQAFLLKHSVASYLEEYNQGQPLAVGQHLTCVVQMPHISDQQTTLRSVHLTVNWKQPHKNVIKSSVNLPLHALIPGMLVETVVMQVMEMGLLVKFLTYEGFIHKSQLNQICAGTHSYHEFDKLNACVLHVHPVTKTVALSLNSHLFNPFKCLTAASLFLTCEIGQRIKKAEIIQRLPRRGLYLKLDDAPTYGFASLSNTCQDNSRIIPPELKVGSQCVCRILDCDYMDRVLVVTTKRSIIDQQFLTYEDVKIGSVTKCIIKAFHPGGMAVSCSCKLRGFVPNIHISDFVLSHPEKKFHKEEMVKCRVISCEPQKARIILSCKKSIVNTDLPVICSYEDAKTGVVSEGVIVQIQQNGLLVTFCGDVKGWVPRSEMGYTEVRYPEKVFTIGQVVKCRITNCKLQEKRLFLTLKLAADDSSRITKSVVPDDFEIGKLVDVEVLSKTETGLNVKLIPSNLPAFLPIVHLSDHLENCQLLAECYTPADVISDCVYVDNTTLVVVSKKKLYVTAQETGRLISRFEDVQVGIKVVGTVKKLMPYGIFVELFCSLVGLVPKNMMANTRLSEDVTPFHVGQSVVAVVTDVDVERKRFLMSLRAKDVYSCGKVTGLDLLEDYLQQWDFIMSNYQQGDILKQLAALKIGQVLDVTVAGLLSHGVKCFLDENISGLASMMHVEEGRHYKDGDIVEAVVLYVDLANKCVELSLDPNFVKLIKRCQNHVNIIDKVKEDQMLLGEVKLIKDHFILVMLRGHLMGQFVFVPSHKHVNDFSGEAQYYVGHRCRLVAKRFVGGRLLCIFTHSVMQHDVVKHHKNNLTSRKQIKEKQHRPPDALKMGETYQGEITAMHEFQANVSVGNHEGRLFITEITDDIVSGESPLTSLAVGSKVTVKVIGSRERKTHVRKGFEITQPCIVRTFYDFTMLPTKLSDDFLDEEEYVPGQVLNAFVDCFSKSCLWMHVSSSTKAKVFLLNISTELTVLRAPEKHFQPGHAYKAHVVGETKGKLELSLTGMFKIQPGIVLSAFISQVIPCGVRVWLPFGCHGFASLPDICDEYKDNITERYKEGQLVKCYAIEYTEKKKNKVPVSFRESRVDQRFSWNVHDPEIDSVSLLTIGDIVRGYVKAVGNAGATIILSRKLEGKAEREHITKEADVKLPEVLPVGHVVTAKIIGLGHKVNLSLLPEDTGKFEWNLQARNISRKMSENMSRPRKRKNSSSAFGTELTAQNHKKRKSISEKKIQKLEEKESCIEDKIEVVVVDHEMKHSDDLPRLPVSEGFWNITMPCTPQKHRTVKQIKAIAGTGVEDNDSSSVQKFEESVSALPNKASVWIRYMNFYIKTADVDSARHIGDRALETISFREEHEKLDVWTALFKLESLHGTAETLNTTVQRALQTNDPLKVHQKLVNVYTQCGKNEQAEALYNTMCRRYSRNKLVWINYMTFCMNAGQAAVARKLLQKSLQCLDKQDHVEVTAKFAELEFKFGEPERGKMMFESILSTYAKRTDLWSVYIDMMVKLEEYSNVRQIFERVIHINWAPRKMKFFFKKFLDFEEKHGSPETVDHVKRLAMEYVEQHGETNMD